MLALSRNIGGFTKCWRFLEIYADLQNVGGFRKYRRFSEK
jgi:hypothetical protein